MFHSNDGQLLLKGLRQADREVREVLDSLRPAPPAEAAVDRSAAECGLDTLARIFAVLRIASDDLFASTAELHRLVTDQDDPPKK